MILSSSRRERKVFFPWERKRGLFGFVSRARARIFVGVALLLAMVIWLRQREETAASVRATRASIVTAERAVMAFRADHPGACPRWEELVAGGYSRDVPEDAWGRPLRLTCPGRRDPRGFDLASDGADGVPGGLDRIE
jgi:general secretion pathway protein G